MPFLPPPSFCMHKYVGILITLSRGKRGRAPLDEKASILYRRNLLYAQQPSPHCTVFSIADSRRLRSCDLFIQCQFACCAQLLDLCFRAFRCSFSLFPVCFSQDAVAFFAIAIIVCVIDHASAMRTKPFPLCAASWAKFRVIFCGKCSAANKACFFHILTLLPRTY